MELEIQRNAKSVIENNIQAEIENNIQAEIENKIQAEIENNIQAEIENNIQAEMENNVQPEVENTNNPEIENNVPPEIEKTAKDVQQQFANNIGYHGAIVWDRFTENDKDALVTKLELLFPTLEEPEVTLKKQSGVIKQTNYETLKKRKHLLEQIWAQRVYCGGNLKMSIIYVLWTPTIAKNDPIAMAKNSTVYSTHPVFRIWKCSLNGESKDCCKIFIDETGRVYENWRYFTKNNTYPEGILIMPKDGIYDTDENDEVILDFKISPTAKPLNRAMKKADRGASIFGVLSAIPATAALFTPLAPLAFGSVAIGAASTAYSMGRSIANLIDRGQHKQTINLKNAKSRQNWLNIFGGAITLGANGALAGATKHLATGNALPKFLENTLKGVNMASIAVNGAGLGNGIAEVVKKGYRNNEMSSLDMLQLSTSLCLFTHSIYNYQLATKIVDNSHGNIGEIETNLFTEQRDVLTEMVNKTLLLQGSATPHCVDLIRSLGKIPDITSGLITCGANLASGRINDWTEQITNKFFVASEEALTNCLSIISNQLEAGTIDMMLSNTEKFFEEILSEIKNEYKPLIPFEHVLWDIFDISSKSNEDKEITEEFLTTNMNDIISKVKTHYCDYLDQDSESAIKCKICEGYYQKTKLSE